VARHVLEGRTHRKKEKAKGDHEQNGPQNEQQDQRNRAIDPVYLLAQTAGLYPTRQRGPRSPGSEEEEPGNAQPSGWAARQDDGLKRVERDGQQKKESDNEGRAMQSLSEYVLVFRL
jgi:hypothetical protein